MLNGKFYTGLPPKMVERQCGNGQNRQESHFFWPDDTRVDSAQETRVKRRNSLQLESERPRQLERNNSFQAESTQPEVDTRQMFHKEFAKSSIQFYDNLQHDNPSNSNSHRSRLPSHRRREVTPKLTDVATVPRSLPPIKDVDEIDPSAAKRKQAYSSTIQFYDYVNTNEANPTQNNTRRPKMDMNNKREVELNTKNSPKLQVKHNVRHLSVEREQQLPLRVVTKKPLNDGPQWEQEQYESVRRSPKKILKQPQWIEDVDVDAQLDYVDNGVRLLRMRSPTKHVTYNEEAAEYAYYEPQQQRQQLRTGSGQQQQQQQLLQTGPYVETGRETKSLNNYNKQSHNNYHEHSNNTNANNNNNSRGSRKILPKMPETTTTSTRTTPMRSQRFDDTRTTAVAAAEASPLSPSDPRKHLRSSLCFNGDALVVDVGAAAAQSTSAVALARRSSAGQRVSVGLPD